ncbi:MAG: arsenate reductase ArsC [Chloroflexi bacterium]|nr:arsenate reductase ArsC [Chloroflexota bacterium]
MEAIPLTEKRILILCTANSARSQMAEGLLRDMAGSRFEIHSAGSEPSTVNPYAIRVMEAAGIDISDHRSKHLEEYLQTPFDIVITVCDKAAETCPVFPGPAERIHWGFPDPAAVEGTDAEKMAAFSRVRDAIRDRLTTWLETN